MRLSEGAEFSHIKVSVKGILNILAGVLTNRQNVQDC